MNGGRFVATLALVLLACAGQAQADLQAAPGGRLLLSGSSTMAPLVAEIAKRFQARHPGVQVEMQVGGSGRGVADARQGKADIGMASRALTEAERDLHGFPIARDGVAVVVHKNNPVPPLTHRQILDVYTGKVANWKQLGGREAPILTVGGLADSGSTEPFLHYLGIRYAELRLLRVVGPNPERLGVLAVNANAIVYVSLGEAERKAQAGAPYRLLPVDGVPAGSKTLRSGDYPIARPLTLITRSAPTGLARQFIEFALSAEVTDFVLAYDFVPYLD